MEKVPITRDGFNQLQARLLYLRRVVRPQILQELEEARALGIKIENQEYISARERYLIVQKQIQELTAKIASCEIFAGRKFYSKQVGFGAIATIRNLETGEVHVYQLVGPFEADVTKGKLSIDSPVGKSLIGRREGDNVTVYTPGGVRVYHILSIQI